MTYTFAMILGTSICYSSAAGAQELRITGRVASAEGLPLSGAYVYLDSLKVITRVDSSGRYELPVPDSAVRGQPEKLVAIAKGHVLSRAAVTLSGATLAHDFVLRVDTMPEHKRRFPNLSDGRTPKSATDVVITGRVVNESGVAVAGASLRLEGVGFAASTDDSGRYTLAIPARVAEAPTTFIVSRMDFALTRVSAPRAGAPAARTFVMSKRIYSGVAAPLGMGIVRAAGLSDLRRGNHPSGEREIRIRIDGGIALPYTLYRFVSRNGGISGEVVRYMPLDGYGSEFAGSKGHSAGSRDSCAKTESQSFFPCRARFSRDPDWRRLFTSMDSLDVWNIADEGTLHKHWTIMLDGPGGITAELRDGKSYKAWAYEPGVEDTEPGRAKVSFISHLLRGVDSLVIY
jgi:hypothetical protein